jgi:A/G-specific adenine glycosylase
MLQQTQVATVIPYFQRFIATFPTIHDLASASIEQVLARWSGLGYYARGRNLHASARLVAERLNGEFPRSYDEIVSLPGIGRSTAAAICALAFHKRYAILDGNVKRVLARYFGVDGWPGDGNVEKRLWTIAESLLPDHDIATYIQAQMDLGATICMRGKPACDACPLREGCIALRSGQVGAYPAPRPRKPVPEKRATFLIILHGDEILFEKRAPQGIWGGLLCFPQLGAGREEVDEYLAQNGLVGAASETLPQFSHTFTHFRLHINPVLLRVERTPLAARERGGVWMNISQALGAEIPVPVRKVLNMILQGVN